MQVPSGVSAIIAFRASPFVDSTTEGKDVICCVVLPPASTLFRHQFYGGKKRASDFHETKKSDMNSYFYVAGLLLVGFVIYVLIRDKIFDSDAMEPFAAPIAASIPAPSSIEIRQAPLYEPQTTSASGPNPPSASAPSQEVVVYSEPRATDPYQENQESSDIPENWRHPERSFRAPPVNDQSGIAVQSGVASHTTHHDNSQQFQTETISGGGEFMPGIFANDTFHDTSFSSF